MKRIIIFPILILAILVIYNGNKAVVDTNLARWVNFSFCEKPTEYRIGKIDKEFDINSKELEKASQQAANIWNSSYKKPLFVENPVAKLSINLIYDGRQKIVKEINTLDEDVTKNKQLLDALSIEYDEKKIRLELDISKLNQEIEYWNNKGGAPEEKYKELVSQTDNLNFQTKLLNELAEKINSNVTSVNNEIQNLNKNVDTFNSTLKVQPEMGTYTSGKEEINIYFYDSNEELVSVIAHELGHALGIGHIEDEESLMSTTSSKVLTLTEADKMALENLCEEQNRFKLLTNDIKNFVRTIVSKPNSL